MKVSSQPLVSVVTPVYNGAENLVECIESVLAQTYENWEYVIVNNCSTDRTLEIVQHYTQLDNRIRIHNNDKFLSLFQNWNHALRQISSESKYCKVVHADDWLFPECITEMVRVAEMNPLVGIVGAYRLLSKPTSVKVGCNGLSHTRAVVSGRELCRLALMGKLYLFGTPTSLLIRSDIIRNRKNFYNEANLYADADAEACYDVLQHTDFGFVHQILTGTRFHDDSETSSFADRFTAFVPGKIVTLTKYGPVYLSRDEYEQRKKELMREYYRVLGHSVFHLKGREFWDYHKTALKSLGYPLSIPRLIKATFLRIIEALLNPHKIVEKIIRKFTSGALNFGPHR